jgi:Domain of Unknown Function (DUF349)
VLNKIFFRSDLHDDVDPAQRVQGIAALAPDSAVLASLLALDPAPEVRIAAAERCTDLGSLSAALTSEAVPSVVAAISAALGKLLATAADTAGVVAFLGADACTDAIRAAVASHTDDEERCTVAIQGIRSEDVLVDLSLTAAHARVRLAAAERVHAPDNLRRLAEGSRDKDRGVTRLARQRLDAVEHGAEQVVTADALLAQAEALAVEPNLVASALVDLDRRWKANDLRDDPERLARWDAIGLVLQQRLQREAEAHRERARFAQRLNEWLASLQAVPAVTALPAIREELLALRAQATEGNNAKALERLAEAEARLVEWEQAAPALIAAEALVIEAEAIAADTPIDNAQLPERWQALDLAVRTPALTRRFEAALLIIEQRRLAFMKVAEQEQGTARQQLHALLHTAEVALAAGQLQEARAAADKLRPLRGLAGQLPKPTVQRMGKVAQQLGELERWQKFGQQTARVQLCERAEALLTQTHTPTALAREVQQLRAEWKKLDEQQSGVPKALWERFDRACEKAYAPAARHFAEESARYKQGFKQREEFIFAAEVHAPTLLAEPRDWRAVERWLHDTDTTWRGKTLGSVQESAWKKLDARLKAVLAPLREAYGAARTQAKAERQALITEAQALAAKAMDRDAPSKVKDLQSRWQAHAKSMTIAPRDERVLWETFRTACNAVFDARKKTRDEAEERVKSQRHVFEALCEQLDQLVANSEMEEAQVRRTQRELHEQWTKAAKETGPVPAPVEARYRSARSKIDDVMRARNRAKEVAVWRTLLDKERLCEELETLALAEQTDGVDAAKKRFAALPALTAAWEKKLAPRWDAALQAVSSGEVRTKLQKKRAESMVARRDALLELELMLGLESPRELQAERRAIQVRQLRDRFKGADSAAAADGILIEWCACPGVVDERDRARCDQIIAAIERRR